MHDDNSPNRPMRRRGRIRGTLVGVRLQPELLQWLDAVRGNEWTRPEAVRLILRSAQGKGDADNDNEGEGEVHADQDAA
jgi:hypothetical protein